ncbi:protein BIC1-like [Salvia divinorum]|uniref:Protein BIC1-like n=1 Tax=Salvia divinorum TaxID=28513 RepID=A0ABD1IBR7_SALDI
MEKNQTAPKLASEGGSEPKLGHEKRREGPAESGRERLKRHRGEVAGRVRVPETWGKEDFLKDWVDSAVFDAAVRSGGITKARAALMEEGRRSAAAGGFRIQQKSC